MSILAFFRCKTSFLLQQQILYFLLNRDELHQRLQIVSGCIYGAALLFPVWKDKTVEGLAPPTMVADEISATIAAPNVMQAFVGCISRKQIAERMHKFFGKHLKGKFIS